MIKLVRESYSDQSSYHTLGFKIEPESTTKVQVIVTIPASFVDTVYQEASIAQRDAAKTYGFQQDSVPLDYITKTYQTNLIEHLKEFLLKFFVIGFLYHEIRHQKLTLADDPQLLDIDLEPHKDAHYYFELHLFPSVNIITWKYLPFKPPVRKRYKDLDRQVDTFVEEEQTLSGQKKG